MLSLCLLSACAPHISQMPTVPPVEEGPHNDPARDAQSRLLEEAYRAFVQERYQTAVLFFRRFLDGPPGSARLAEARWWLGRAYEQIGEYRAAMTQYRVLASGQLSQHLNGTLYEGHALRRLDELRQLHGNVNGRSYQLALRLGMTHIPVAPGLKPWLEEVAQNGVTAIVVEAFQTPSTGRGVSNSDRLKAMVTEAHTLGLQVWAAVDIHRPPGLPLKPEWVSQMADGRARDNPSLWPDIANSDYQSALEDVVKMLSRSGCDGLFVPARPVPGFSREFSDSSFRQFAMSFGPELSPLQVLGAESSDGTAAQERAALYWRWVGWKAQAYIKLVTRLQKVMRERLPTAALLLEVHQVSFRSPLEGLEQYGEDVAELAQRTGGVIVVRRDAPGVERLVEKYGQGLGAEERVWVEIPIAWAGIPPSVGTLKHMTYDMIENRNRHLLITPEPAATVP